MQSKNSQSGIRLAAQGTLLTVKPYNLERQGNNEGKSTRGEVTEFSPRSRKRLLELVASLESPEKDGYRSTTSFLTLTTQKIHGPRQFKEFLFTWLKRLKRKSPTIAAIWRIEYQQRGATHAHMILFNAPYVSKEWIQSSWGEVVEQKRPFTRIEQIKQQRKVMSYAAKYVAKTGGFNNLPYLTVDQETGEVANVGRQWGVYNRIALPYAEKYDANIPLDGSWWLIRRYCQKIWDHLELDTYNGFTIFCDDPLDHMYRLCVISKQFIAAANNA